MKIRLVLSLGACVLAACGTSSPIEETIASAEAIVCRHPDSARLMLAQVDRRAITSRRIAAAHALAYSRALDKCYIDVDDDSLVRRAAAYYLRRGSVAQRAAALYYRGVVEKNRGDDSAALRTLMEACPLAEQAGDDYLCGLIYNRMGDIYNRARNYARAEACARNSYACYSRAHLPYHVNSSLYWIGANAFLQQNYTTAERYLLASDSMARMRGDRRVERNSVDYLIYLYFYKEEYDRIPDLVERLKRLTDQRLTYNSHLVLGTLQLRAGSLDSARWHLRRARTMENSTHARTASLRLAYRIDERAGDYAAALTHYRRYCDLMDSLGSAVERKALLQAEQAYRTEALEHRNFRLRTHNRYVAIALLAALVAALYAVSRYRRWLRERDAKIREYMAIVTAANEAHSRLRTQLNDRLAQEERFKNLLDKRFKTVRQFTSLVYKYEHHPKQLYKQLRDVLNIDSVDTNEFKDLIDIINTQTNGSIDMMRSAYPQLNEADVIFCCLIYAGFTMEEMCVIYNLSTLGSLYTKRSRLKHKFEIDENVDLNKFLSELIDK